MESHHARSRNAARSSRPCDSIVDGTIEIDGDEDEVIEAYLDLVRVQYELNDMSRREAEDQLDYARDSLEDTLDLPVDVDFRDYEDDTGFPFSLVTVAEGAGWYVSPLLSYADFLYVAAESNEYLDVGRLGTAVPAPVPAADAAHAAQNTLLAALDTSAGKSYWADLAATLPLAERRLVAIYGPAFGGNPWDYLTDEGGSLEVDSSAFVGVDGAHAVPDDVTVTWEYPRNDAHGEIFVDAQCAEWEYTQRYWDSYWDEWDTSRNDAEGCLDDLPIDLDAAVLGLAGAAAGLGFVAVVLTIVVRATARVVGATDVLAPLLPAIAVVAPAALAMIALTAPAAVRAYIAGTPLTASGTAAGVLHPAADPATPAEQLSALASDPANWVALAGNPASYPELLAYLGAHGDAAVQQVLKARSLD